MEYTGPKMIIKHKHFSKDLKARGGFEKVTYFKCYDGDTAVFKLHGNRENVRFLVINTPEIGDNPKPYAVEAKTYLENVLENAKEIYIQSDKHTNLRDNTERRRFLCWVWADGELVNYNLVRLGFAKCEYIDSKKLYYLKDLQNAEKLARKEKLRIFSEGGNNVSNS